MSSFRAVVVDKPDGHYTVAVKTLTENDLMEGDVTVKVLYSCVNYKDGLALTGKAPVVRKFPMVPGIDLSGIVTASGSTLFKPGDTVVLKIGRAHV